jgi:hypothetical protein
MSWIKSAGGNEEHVRSTMSQWADEQKATDQGYSLAQDAADGHTRQIDRTLKTVGEFMRTAPAKSEFTVNASGHHNGSGTSDQASVSVSYYVPALPTASILPPTVD